MEVWVYIVMCLPAILMTIVGIALGSERRHSTITQHHFAKKFNIKNYAKSVMKLFIIAGIAFSAGGMIIVSGFIIPGIIIILLTLVIFLVKFASIHREN